MRERMRPAVSVFSSQIGLRTPRTCAFSIVETSSGLSAVVCLARPPLRRVLRAFPSGAMCLDIVAEALLERLALRQAGQALGSSDVPTLTRINPSRDQVAGLLRPLAGFREGSR